MAACTRSASSRFSTAPSRSPRAPEGENPETRDLDGNRGLSTRTAGVPFLSTAPACGARAASLDGSAAVALGRGLGPLRIPQHGSERALCRYQALPLAPLRAALAWLPAWHSGNRAAWRNRANRGARLRNDHKHRCRRWLLRAWSSP